MYSIGNSRSSESSDSNEFNEMWEEGIKCQVSLVGISYGSFFQKFSVRCP